MLLPRHKRAYFMNGPQFGSRILPACVVRRCLTRPSTDTTARPGRPPLVAYMMYLPLGEKLGSPAPSARRSSCPLVKSMAYREKPPSRWEIQAMVLPSDERRGLML